MKWNSDSALLNSVNIQAVSWRCDLDEILDYMINEKWKVDIKQDRKLEFWKIAKKSQKDVDVLNKIGGLLIYNQLIDEFLKDIVEYSIMYIKAEIWPASFALKINFDNKTFGQNIELFKQYATIEYNREILLEYLGRFNKKRNQVVHNLFAVEDMQKLKREIEEHMLLADEIIGLLIEYDNCICHKFIDLSKRVEFESLADWIEE